MAFDLHVFLHELSASHFFSHSLAIRRSCIHCSMLLHANTLYNQLYLIADGNAFNLAFVPYLVRVVRGRLCICSFFFSLRIIIISPRSSNTDMPCAHARLYVCVVWSPLILSLSVYIARCTRYVRVQRNRRKHSISDSDTSSDAAKGSASVRGKSTITNYTKG